jgi:hypothetical protein
MIYSGFNAVEAVKKAMLTTPDLATYGVKTPEQMNRFIALMRKEPKIFQNADVFSMTTKEKVFSKMDLTQRVLHASTEGTGLTEDQYRKPTYSETTVSTIKVSGGIPITYDSLEDNIAGNNLKASIREMFVKRISEDFAELIWNGDTTSTDPFLAQKNGLLALLSSNTYDFTNNTVNLERLGFTYKKVPDRYLSRIRDFKFYLHPTPVFNYRESLPSRETDLGDTVTENYYTPRPLGYQMVECPLINTYTNGSDTNTQGIFTMPENIKIGIYRPLNIKLVDVPLEDRMILHVSGRIGWNFLVEDMVVLMDNVKHG